MTPNFLPLVLVLLEAHHEAGSTSFEAAVIHAAVHGWMEGHLAAPGHLPGPPGEMPDPPFPNPADQALQDIVDETHRRFAEDERVGAVAFAVGEGWRAGHQAGKLCTGCAILGADDPLASAMRAGRGSFHYLPEGLGPF